MHKKDFLSPWHHWHSHEKALIALIVVFLLLLSNVYFEDVMRKDASLAPSSCRMRHPKGLVGNPGVTATSSQVRTLRIGGLMVHAEIAATDEARTKGLSGRPVLLPNEGMLFVFPQPGYYAFWMKDMLVPLDIVWLDASGKVLHIEGNLPPSSDPETYMPPVRAHYVLELPAGTMAVQGVKVGDMIEGIDSANYSLRWDF